MSVFGGFEGQHLQFRIGSRLSRVRPLSRYLTLSVRSDADYYILFGNRPFNDGARLE